MTVNKCKFIHEKKGELQIYKSEIMSTGKVILGALAGAAIGATLGILFAPDKGKTTRRNISNKKEDYLEDIETKFNRLFRSMSDKYDDMKSEISQNSGLDRIKKESKIFSNGNG